MDGRGRAGDVGTSDILTLIENCRYFCGDQRIPFLETYIDLQAYCQKQLGGEPGKQMGLTTAAELLGISGDDFDHHRALGDSLLSCAACSVCTTRSGWPRWSRPRTTSFTAV
ncbi:MAG: hypothetical protein ACLU9S_21285 [Oscillospiraceae bacterium]